MELEYTVKRSAGRKKLTITVERDSAVVVHSPIRVTDEKIRQVIESKKQWIFEKLRHPQKYQSRPHAPGKELVSGESILYLGRNYSLEVVEHGLDEIRFDHRFFIPAAQRDHRRSGFRDWYIQRAKDKILPRVNEHAHKMGVEFKLAKIVDNRYRWGSCTVKDNVNFNWRLIKAPMLVIDYVIIHELAHLIESNHTPRFWNIVRSQSPTTEKAKVWLKEHGQILEEDV